MSPDASKRVYRTQPCLVLCQGSTDYGRHTDRMLAEASAANLKQKAPARPKALPEWPLFSAVCGAAAQPYLLSVDKEQTCHSHILVAWHGLQPHAAQHALLLLRPAASQRRHVQRCWCRSPMCLPVYLLLLLLLLDPVV
jgi:hypothetical protein